MVNENKKLFETFPDSPGVYFMYNKKDEVIYIGKAGNLKKRVSSYFTKAHDKRVEELVKRIDKIDYKEADSVLDALIMESRLIKEMQPTFNIREKDDKSFLWVEITKDDYPRVLLTRGNEKDLKKDKKSRYFGPFVYASEIRRALRILRKIFPYSIHDPNKVGKFKRLCLDAEIGLCPGTCIGDIDKDEYKNNIKGLIKVLRGNKKSLIRDIKKQMKSAADSLKFEKAAKMKKRLFALQHIQDTSLISDEKNKNIFTKEISKKRTEGYDISNISGTYATGSMVVFEGTEPNKDEYRKFKIRTIKGQNDTGMLREVIKRRFDRYDEGSNKSQWPLPDLILIDGGKGQVNAAKKVIEEKGFKIPVIGIAKGAKRKNNRIIGEIPDFVSKSILIKVRDEAHRFATKYHRNIRQKGSLGKN